ncbi:Putative ATPase involved in DNA repair [Salmonella enterica subsp. enterica]|nr:Putative ATPase involved in DNA repair [Salmonella enterica subsp. enterica]
MPLARSGGHPSANPAADRINYRVAGGNSRAGSGFFPSGRQRIPPGAGKCGTGLSPVREQQQEAQFRYARDQRLSADERSELKRLWRQASRLCHPDVVADELKEKAHQMMVQLNQARQNADLAAIRALLTQLQSGLEPMMASDRLNNLEHLRHKIRQLRTQIDALLKEITQLETENAWRLASSVADKEAYFSEQERALTEIRNTLEAQVQQVEQELLSG